MTPYREADPALATCAVCAVTVQPDAAGFDASGRVICRTCNARHVSEAGDRVVRRWNAAHTPAMWLAAAFLPVAVLVYGFLLRFCGASAP